MNLHLRHSETNQALPAKAPSPVADLNETDDPSGLGSLVEKQWLDAQLAIHLLLMPGGTTGIRLRGRHGPARQSWLENLRAAASQRDTLLHRISSAAPTSQLLPGLDLAATLDAGRPVETDGMIRSAKGGILIVSGAERLTAEAAALLAQAVDDRQLRIVALDEGLDDEDTQLPSALASRLEISIQTDGIPLAVCRQVGAPIPENADAKRPVLPSDLQMSLAQALDGLAQTSPSTLLHCCKTARALAQIAGDRVVQPHHAHHALQLVLGVTLAPPQPEEETEAGDPEVQPEQPQEQSQNQSSEAADEAQNVADAVSEDVTVETEHGAALDPAILFAMAEQLTNRQGVTTPNASSGAGAKRRNTRRGRPTGYSENAPYADARPDILATLRAAAPWQKIRQKHRPADAEGRVLIRSSDFRYRRLHQPRETVTIFVVDASGSTATQRLGEAKGAIERLLADCYVRRDNVALIAFRGQKAEVLLEPTRSLVRAKKGLSALPGGGATPLASGLDEGARMALRARREGQTPLMVILSDGSANMGLDGQPGRPQANADAMRIAQQIRAHALPCLFVDTGRRPRSQSYELSAALGAELIQLPKSAASGLEKIVASRLSAS
ncbi:MAG: VWA domain-containing protein [Pseudomonadota bacterium]